MVRQSVVDLGGQPDELGLGAQQHLCANPRCDVQFSRVLGPGRRKDFHDDDCRRNSEQDLRRILSHLAHYERQAEQLRARASSYIRTNPGEVEAEAGPSAAQRQAARDAILEVRGMARFLPGHQGEFAADLLKLLEAVEPVVLG